MIRTALLFATLALAGLSITSSAHADEGFFSGLSDRLAARRVHEGWTVASGFRSHHLDRQAHLNERNEGLGLRSPEGWTAGAYYNSYRRYSTYAGREYQWRMAGGDSLQLRIGTILGGISGYRGGLHLHANVTHGIHLMALPELIVAVPHAELAMMFIPSESKTPATLAAQLRVSF
ncbi:hypothetical protein ACFONG_01135 [Uliginosibacterium paludis]|uniref:Uncharacterized protein n=1 Tax=Uliginosibacterium paludis TaxID=1615952 RepID=A0ABV2CQS8_9RHOO